MTLPRPEQPRDEDQSRDDADGAGPFEGVEAAHSADPFLAMAREVAGSWSYSHAKSDSPALVSLIAEALCDVDRAAREACARMATDEMSAGDGHPDQWLSGRNDACIAVNCTILLTIKS